MVAGRVAIEVAEKDNWLVAWSLQNSPQYIATSEIDHELELQYKVHAALDVVEEKCNTSNKTNVDINRDLYLGLLYCTEQHKM